MSQQEQQVKDSERPGLPTPFRCTRGREGNGATWVRASGELDITGAAQLADVLAEALASARLVVLDLHDLEFLDSCGIHVIQDASAAALKDGRRMVVALAPPTLTRLFALAGTSDSVELFGREEFEQ